MSTAAVILLGLVIALAVRSERQLRRAGRLGREAAMALRYSGLRLLELQRLQTQQLRLEDAQRLAETAIETGTDVARSVHMGIARVPFDVLDALPATRDVSRVVRQTHDVIADAVYGSIKGVNRGIGHLTRGLLKPPTRTNSRDDE